MLKLYPVLAGFCVAAATLVQPALGQTTPPRRSCGTMEADAWQQTQLKRLDPSYDPSKRTANSPLLRESRQLAATTYTLPIVVHVIHNGEAVGTGTNLSKAQVLSQIDVLNEDYRKVNTDGAQVPSVFQALRSDMQIQFAPANIDPNGKTMAEPGIDRVDRNAKGWSVSSFDEDFCNTTLKPGTYWDPNKYINVWVCNLAGGDPGFVLLGYAQFPDNTAGLGGLSTKGGAASTDGVVIWYKAFGRVGSLSAGSNHGRTLTHELGHFFGLRHVWGDSNCGNDYCGDTPTQQTSNSGCPSFPHVTCSNGPNGDIFMDYMDYSDDACLHLFTPDQKDRMQAVMAAGTPRRSSLATSPVICQSSIAATASASSAVCVGGTLALSATGPAGATYAWSGPNGFSSTQQSPTLPNATVAMSGTYTLRVTQDAISCPKTLTLNATVNALPGTPTLSSTAAKLCAGSAATLSATLPPAVPNEDFNGAAPGWVIASTGTAGTGWQLVNAPYNYTSKYLVLSNYSPNGTRFAIANSDAGGTAAAVNTTLTTPGFSTMGATTLRLTFQHLLKFSGGDVVTVEATTDGNTWNAVATYAKDQGTTTAPATTSINLNAYVNNPVVQVRWRYKTGYSFCWAIDNVQFSGDVPAPAYTYAWSLVSGDGLPAAASAASITVTPTQASVYQLTASLPGGCPVASAQLAVGVAATAAATPALTLSGSTFSTPAVAGASYQFYLNGTALPSTSTNTLMATQAGTYAVVITSAAGCSSSPSAAVQYAVVTATRAGQSTLELTVTPNPTPDGRLTITFSNPTRAAQLTVLNSLGQLVRSQALPAATTTAHLDLSSLAPGVYVLQATSTDGTSTRRIVRE